MYKVVLISQDFYPMKGGIASYLMNIYKKYLKNTEFSVIVPDFIGKEKDYGSLPFKVYRTKFTPFNLNDDIRRKASENILSIIDRIKPDVILFGYLRSHPEIGELYKKNNPSSIWGIFIHAKEIFIDNCITDKISREGKFQKGYNKQEAAFYKEIIKKADIVFSVSNFSKQIMKDQGINREIILLRPSINTFNIKLVKEAKSLLKIKESDLLMLSVGRLIPRKGQAKLVGLIPSLLKEYPNLKYFVVGDGPDKEKILHSIEEEKLIDVVNVFDNVETKDLPLFYSACDFFILPCNFIKPNDVEGFGIVFLEANLYGKPVIALSKGGVKEAVINMETGILIDSNSNKDLMEAIKTMIENPSLRNKLGEIGKQRVLKDYNLKESNYLIELFTNILKN